MSAHAAFLRLFYDARSSMRKAACCMRQEAWRRRHGKGALDGSACYMRTAFFVGWVFFCIICKIKDAQTSLNMLGRMH